MQSEGGQCHHSPWPSIGEITEVSFQYQGSLYYRSKECWWHATSRDGICMSVCVPVCMHVCVGIMTKWFQCNNITIIFNNQGNHTSFILSSAVPNEPRLSQFRVWHLIHVHALPMSSWQLYCMLYWWQVWTCVPEMVYLRLQSALLQSFLLQLYFHSLLSESDLPHIFHDRCIAPGHLPRAHDGFFCRPTERMWCFNDNNPQVMLNNVYI